MSVASQDVFIPEVSIILPVWDLARLTAQFCNSVLDYTHSPANELIVIDNGSIDDTPIYLWNMLRRYSNRCQIITNPENLGFGRAANQGFAIARGTYLVLGHNDIHLHDARWLEMLIAPVRENKKRLVGPQYIDYNELTRVDGKIIPYIGGWLWAFHKDFLQDVGYFWEGFRGAYFEDVELCWRAQRHGYELYPVMGLPVHHEYGATAVNGPHYGDLDGIGVPAVSERNRRLFIEKVRADDDKPFYPSGAKCSL